MLNDYEKIIIKEYLGEYPITIKEAESIMEKKGDFKDFFFWADKELDCCYDTVYGNFFLLLANWLLLKKEKQIIKKIQNRIITINKEKYIIKDCERVVFKNNETYINCRIYLK